MSDVNIKSCTPKNEKGNRICIVEYKGKKYSQRVNSKGNPIGSLAPMENPKEAQEVKNKVEDELKTFLQQSE